MGEVGQAGHLESARRRVPQLGLAGSLERGEEFARHAVGGLVPELALGAARPDQGSVRLTQLDEGGGGRRAEAAAVQYGEQPLSGLHQGDVAAQGSVLLQQLAGGECARHRMPEGLGPDGLHQVFGRAALDGAHRRPHLVQGRNQHHLHVRVALLGIAEHLHAVPLGEDEVRHHNVKGMQRQGSARFGDAADGVDFVPGVGEVVAVHCPGHLLVIDQENARHGWRNQRKMLSVSPFLGIAAHQRTRGLRKLDSRCVAPFQ